MFIMTSVYYMANKARITSENIRNYIEKKNPTTTWEVFRKTFSTFHLWQLLMERTKNNYRKHLMCPDNKRCFSLTLKTIFCIWNAYKTCL